MNTAVDELTRCCITPGCDKPTHGFRCRACLEYVGKHDRYPENSAHKNGVLMPLKRGKKTAVEKFLTKSEAEIRIEIKNWYRLKGATVVDTEQEREDTRVDAGMSDLIVLWAPRKVRFIEVKSEDGTQLKEQIEFQAAVEACGCVYLLPRSLQEVIDYEEVGF